MLFYKVLIFRAIKCDHLSVAYAKTDDKVLIYVVYHYSRAKRAAENRGIQ